MKSAPRIEVLQTDIYLVPAERPNSHSYLIRGRRRMVLIDTGLPDNLPHLEANLAVVGVRLTDIDLILLTHEHLDHMGGVPLFPGRPLIAAHRMAANKIALGDEFVLSNKYFHLPAQPFSPDLWLEDDTLLDLGNFRLQVMHTPGHCSGCLSIYEPNRRLLFSGDTLLAGGIFPGVLASGNISDQIHSLRRLQTLRVETLLPGHGPISLSPEADIQKAIEAALNLQRDTRLLFDTLNTRKTFERLLGSARNRPPKVPEDRQKDPGRS